MKKLLKAFLKLTIILTIIYLIYCAIFDAIAIDFGGNCEYYITDNVYLSQTSRYMVSLDGKYGIYPYIDKIGWNDKYIVAIRYDLKYENDYNDYKIPDKSKAYYYIIDLEKEELIGPLTKDEFEQYDCSSIRMKKTVI